MFTGIIESVGRIEGRESRGGDIRLRVFCVEMDMRDVDVGDSIAVNGVCLTAVAVGRQAFSADVSAETLARSLLGELPVGGRVNLEKALTLATRLGGHLVSGHVDGVGRVVSRSDDARSLRLVIRAPRELARYLAAKGSICVDGTSLTVNEVAGSDFGVNIVPHTVDHTVIGDYRPGTGVHLEVDLIARYLERLLLGEQAADAVGDGVDLEQLRQAGFTGPAGVTGRS
jgi:riboflavin synthase